MDPFLSLYRDCYPTLQAVQNVVRCFARIATQTITAQSPDAFERLVSGNVSSSLL